MKDLNSCSRCRYFVAVHSVCAAPQLVDLARLVAGKPMPGASMGAFDTRLNQSLCGTPGYWFTADVAPAPETKPLQAGAARAKRKKRL